MRTLHSSVPIKDALVLAAFALTIGCALLLTQRLTESKINAHRQQSLRHTLQAVLPEGQYNNDPLLVVKFLSNGELRRAVYPAFYNTRPVAAAISSTATDGYAGDIELLIGISYDGEITGVRVLSHQETPGLGDKMEVRKSHWIFEFNGKSIDGETVWMVKKDWGDFDQFTGATITPRAIVNTVKHTLTWFSENKQIIFEQ